MNKTLLVLAASSEQMETIAGARGLGYRVVTLDNRPDNPGHALADSSYNVDTTDLHGALKVARQENIDGIIAPCTDVAVPTAAYIAQELHLKGPPLASANVVCSKVRFRQFLGSHGFPVPQFVPFAHGFDPDGSFFRNGQYIVKPDQSSGSKGAFVVRSRAEFLQRSTETLSFSPTGTGILEKYIDGRQGTCEGFLKDGLLAFACILDRRTAALPYVTTSGHSLPTRLPSQLQRILLDDLSEVWSLLGITDGPFDCDFVATHDKVYLLEISPRMGGNSISTLLRIALGFNMVEYSIRHALNEEVVLPPQSEMRPSAIVVFGVPERGRLRYDRAEADALLHESWIRALSFEADWDATVCAFINSRHRIGHAILVGENRDDVDAKVQELSDRLCLRVAHD